MGEPPIRMGEPETYEGGELIIQSEAGTSAFKSAKGDGVLYLRPTK